MGFSIKSFAVVLAGVSVAGCSSRAENVLPSYVSPIVYQSLDCQQIAGEISRVSSRAAQAAGTQDSNASRDAVATGVAIVIFWPAAFLIGRNKQNEAELARLKGEMEALEQAAVQKSCGFEFRRDEPAPPSPHPTPTY